MCVVHNDVCVVYNDFYVVHNDVCVVHNDVCVVHNDVCVVDNVDCSQRSKLQARNNALRLEIKQTKMALALAEIKNGSELLLCQAELLCI